MIFVTVCCYWLCFVFSSYSAWWYVIKHWNLVAQIVVLIVILNSEKYSSSKLQSKWHLRRYIYIYICNKKRKRKRRIIYYNPPFCNSVSTNIGRKFIQLIDKTFTADHPYRKIFNRNSLKLSYSCMPNIKRIIHAHNWKILNSTKEKQEPKCNCRKKKECPVQGKCQIANVIYKASLRNDGTTKYYVGSTGMKFKDRYALHKSSFNKKDSKATELAKAVCELKRTNKNFELSWEIICRTRKKFDLKSGCKLCNLEKIEISKIKKEESLNKRTELQSICPHYRNMFLWNYGHYLFCLYVFVPLCFLFYFVQICKKCRLSQ